jgi:hypothetical protein
MHNEHKLYRYYTIALSKCQDERKRERVGIVLCVALYFLLRLWNLPHLLISDKFDEGVYLSLMLGVSGGKGALYRDYILCHPPGVLWAGSALWPRFQDSITALRTIYICFCALVLPPMYAIARRYYGVRAALLTLFLLATTPGLANWLGHEIYLDPPLNVPLYIALWMLLCRPHHRRLHAMAAGALVGLSYVIKETALPAGVALCAALWSAERAKVTEHPGPEHSNTRPPDHRTPEHLNSPTPSLQHDWLWFGAAFLIASALTLGALCRIPNYILDTFTLNTNDVRDWSMRLHELVTGFFALPLLLTFGSVGVCLMTWHSAGRHERLLGVYALTMTLVMLVVPKGFYWRYLTGVLPVTCLGVAVCLQRFQAVQRSRRARNTVFVLLILFSMVHLVSLILYRTHESVSPPAYMQALKRLRASQGPLFTLDPIWSAASDHLLIPPVQQLIKATAGLPVTATEADAALSACPTVLLDHTTLRWLPPATLVSIRARYHSIFRYGEPQQSRYVEILSR